MNDKHIKDALDLTPESIDQNVREAMSRVTRPLFQDPEVTDEFVEALQKSVDEIIEDLRARGEIPEKLITVRVERHRDNPFKIALLPLIRLDHLDVELPPVSPKE